jgi:CBS domain-containing protein
LPVVDKNFKLLGIITREDLLRPLYPQYQDVFEYLETSTDFEALEDRVQDMELLIAKDLMSKTVVFTRADTLIMRVLSRMIVRNVDQLPVLTSEDKVIGVVTKGDIFYTLFKTHLLPKHLRKGTKAVARSQKRSRSNRT